VINTLSAAQTKGALKSELKRYLSPALLLLDEIGYLPIDQRGAKNKRADPLRSKDIREISQGRPARRATLDEKYQRSGLFGKVQGAGRAGSGTV
jgi:IstB-like ATP binding protein